MYSILIKLYSFVKFVLIYLFKEGKTFYDFTCTPCCFWCMTTFAHPRKTSAPNPSHTPSSSWETSSLVRVSSRHSIPFLKKQGFCVEMEDSSTWHNPRYYVNRAEGWYLGRISYRERCIWDTRRSPIVISLASMQVAPWMWITPSHTLVWSLMNPYNLNIVNIGNESTFVILDPTYVSHYVREWNVSDEESCSNHKQITLKLEVLAP